MEGVPKEAVRWDPPANALTGVLYGLYTLPDQCYVFCPIRLPTREASQVLVLITASPVGAVTVSYLECTLATDRGSETVPPWHFHRHFFALCCCMRCMVCSRA